MRLFISACVLREGGERGVSQKALLLGLVHLAQLGALTLPLLLAAAASAHADQHAKQDKPNETELAHEHPFSGKFALLPSPVLALVDLLGAIEESVNTSVVTPYTVELLSAVSTSTHRSTQSAIAGAVIPVIPSCAGVCEVASCGAIGWYRGGSSTSCGAITLRSSSRGSVSRILSGSCRSGYVGGSFRAG